MCNYTSICTKHSLSACLPMHVHFSFFVYLMHSSGFLFQFTYLFIYLCCSWLSLNSFRYLLPCVFSFFSSALWFTFHPSTWPFWNPTNVLKLQQLLLGSHIQLYLDIPTPWNEVAQKFPSLYYHNTLESNIVTPSCPLGYFINISL
jgi:hypothetical protein